MNARRTRNPYGARTKPKSKTGKTGRTTQTPSSKKIPVVQQPQLLELKEEKPAKKDAAAMPDWLKNLPQLWTKSPKEIRKSIVNVQEWSSQMRSTMAEMETTLNTLNNMFGMYERWSANQAKNKTSGDKTPLSLSKMLNSIDFRQILTVLNSPLVQAFMELSGEQAGEHSEEAVETTVEENKEG
ncbi:hypothetical protein [Aneurinibacillus terranovensis]|uniref:hypothetical protein n=1 Tax=Aneurinibacillus terranovensis TaxID=278991 RepID=UPI0003FD9C5F|nr:hypothetical protein [Aneurinibacillus terranovensis]